MNLPSQIQDLCRTIIADPTFKLVSNMMANLETTEFQSGGLTTYALSTENILTSGGGDDQEAVTKVFVDAANTFYHVALEKALAAFPGAHCHWDQHAFDGVEAFAQNHLTKCMDRDPQYAPYLCESEPEDDNRMPKAVCFRYSVLIAKLSEQNYDIFPSCRISAWEENPLDVSQIQLKHELFTFYPEE